MPPPYPLNGFPPEFPYRLAREIVCFLVTNPEGAELEGPMWERMFANCIGGQWHPSNLGLDDIRLGQCAWSAKTVKANPLTAKRCRLISGRNSPVYSFGEAQVAGREPNELGRMILDIWNARVSSVRQRYAHARTVVLLKGEGLLTLGVFEAETVRYDPDEYEWRWNRRGNLEGYAKDTDEHRFTWQPHGAQFTIIEPVPEDILIVRIKEPPRIPCESVLEAIGFDDSWVRVERRGRGA